MTAGSRLDAERFDGMIRSLAISVSRRCALTTLLSGSLGLLGLAEATAKKHKKGNKHKKDKPKCGNADGTSAGSAAIGCPKPVKCTNSTACDLNFHCVSGQCVEGCDDDDDCSYGLCVANECSGHCEGHLDCPLGYRCLSGGICGAAACYGDSDCPPGQYCLSDFTCFDPANPG